MPRLTTATSNNYTITFSVSPPTQMRRRSECLNDVLYVDGCDHPLDPACDESDWVCTHHVNYRFGVMHIACQIDVICGLRIEDHMISYPERRDMKHTLPEAIADWIDRHGNDADPQVLKAVSNFKAIIEDTNGP